VSNQLFEPRSRDDRDKFFNNQQFMKEVLEQEIQKAQEGHGWVFNEWQERVTVNGSIKESRTRNGRELLTENILKRYELVGDAWRHKISGQRVDIQGIIGEEVKAKGERAIIRNLKAVSSYVSPFKSRSEAVVQKHAKAMTALINTIIDREGWIFVSDLTRWKAVDILSRNFLAYDTPEGIRFRRVDASGVLSTDSWSFQEVGSQVGFSRLIDKDRSELNQKVIESNLREQASKITGRHWALPNGEEDKGVRAMIEKLRQADEPKTNHIYKGPSKETILSEFRKERMTEENLTNLDLNQERMVARGAEFRLGHINSLSEVQKQFNEIQPPQATDYQY
jgi:hypothetical protein